MPEMKISCIPATKNRQLKLREEQTIEKPSSLSSSGIVRVAAYCRVSTLLETQEGSFEAQKKHFEDLINQHPNWVLVEVYGDYGKSGTSIKHRPQFQRMIQDAEMGKIDYIMTKSVSRFGRNRSEVFEIIDRFKKRSSPIGIYFESGGIDSLDPKSNMLLSILAILAQEQSQIISENVRWAVEKMCRKGKPPYNPGGRKGLFGYTLGEDKKWDIVESEAEVIKRIYGMYVRGMSAQTIANILNSENIFTRVGDVWRPNHISKMVKNEKYIGDFNCFRSFRPDVTSCRVANRGHRENIYIENHHPAIINKKIWILVQIRIRLRRLQYGRFSLKYNIEPQKKIHIHKLFSKLYGINQKGETVRLKRYRIPIRRGTTQPPRCAKWLGTGGGALAYEITIEQCFMEAMYKLKDEQRADKSIPSLDVYYLIALTKLNRRNKEKSVAEELEQLKNDYSTAQFDYEKVKSVAISEKGKGTLSRYLQDLKKDIKAMELEINAVTELMAESKLLKKRYRKIRDMIAALPDVNENNEKLNIPGRDNCMNYFRHIEGGPRKNRMNNYNAGKVRFTSEDYELSPDILPFDSALYHALVDYAVVEGDVIRFYTVFGKIIEGHYAKRTYVDYLGYRYMAKDGMMRVFTKPEEIAQYFFEKEEKSNGMVIC